jgi:hypothetical protein
MRSNHNIEEEKWELLAKSIYDENQQLTAEEQNLAGEELFSDQKEKDQLLLVF